MINFMGWRIWPPTDDAELEAFRLQCIKSLIRDSLIMAGIIMIELAVIALEKA